MRYTTTQLIFDIALLTVSSEVHVHASVAQMQQASRPIAEQLCAKNLLKVPIILRDCLGRGSNPNSLRCRILNRL